MKKILSLVVASMMALSIAACTQAPTTPPATPPATPAPETGLKGEISVQVEEGWKSYYDTAVTRFKEANPDAVVELKVTPAFDHLDVLDNTTVTNPDVADVFAIPADRIFGLAQNEALASIDAKGIADTVGGFDNYDEGLGGNFMIDGDYLAFPMNIETLILYANTKNAATAGIDLTKPIELTELKPNDMLIPMFDAWFGIAAINSADIDLLAKDDAGKLASDFTQEWSALAPEKQAAFTAIYEYWKAADPRMWDAEAAWGYMDTQFTTGGTASLRISGPWDANSFSTQAGNGADLEILPLGTVTIEGKPLKHWKGGWGLAINSRVEEDEDQLALAEAFIAELMNPEFAVDFFKATGKIMENVEASVYTGSDLSDTEKSIIENVLASYQDAPARPLFTEWGQVWDTWKNSVLSWASVKPATVEDAYKEVKASFDAMMLNY